MPKKKIEFSEEQLIGIIGGAIVAYVLSKSLPLAAAGGLVGLIISYVI